MNTKMLKGIGVAISLLVGIGAASPALAKATSARALGIEGNAIDVWTFDCPEGFTKGQARVKDLAATNNAAAQMQVVLSKDGTPTQQVTDEDGEAGSDRSVMATVDGGIGGYVMAFKKTADGVEDYIGEAFCRDANNAIHHPAIDLRIDQ
jgi:hypothetical protein